MCDNGAWVRYSDYVSLKAENERLTKAMSEQIDRDISGIFPTERALAERAGGVKVKALEWKALANTETEVGLGEGRSEYTVIPTKNAWRAYGIPGESDGGTEFFTKDAAKAAAQADYERRILSAIEPAAPEGRQEAVAALRKLLTYGERAEMAAERKGTLFRFDDGSRFFLSDIDAASLTRPSEQAVTGGLAALKKWADDPDISLTLQGSPRRCALLQSDIRAAISTEQAVTEAMVEAAREIIHGARHVYSDEDLARAALKAAMEAGRHD